MSRRRKFLIGIVGFIVICCGLSGLASLLPESKETAEPTDVALIEELQPTPEEPTKTVAPTKTSLPLPTNTVEPPEPTATNTRRPRPTATSTPQFEAASVVDVAGNEVTGETAVVTQIIDGDTIDVEINGETYRVRYIGMDTPERGEPLFQEASEANARLVAGQTVIMVKDVSETDRYGRLLRYVYLEDGTFVNGELVRLGYAQASTYPPDVAFQDTFTSLQRTAVNSGVGLWAPQTVVEAPTSTVLPQPLPTAEPTTSPEQPQPTSPPPQPTNVPQPTEAPQPTDIPPAAPGNVVISSIYYDGQVARVESDEYAEITNQGGTVVNLAGWRLNADDDGQDFWFPDFELQPGQSCRVYTNENHPETCGFSFNSGKAIWRNDGECGHLFDNTGAEVSSRCFG